MQEEDRAVRQSEQQSNKQYLIVAIFLVVLIVAGAISLLFDKKNGEKLAFPTSSPSATLMVSESVKSTPMKNVTDLQTMDEIVGTGDTAVVGKTVTVNYVGTLIDGTKFDSSYDRNQSFSFTLGAGQVIEGWDKGVSGMKVGGKRKLIIPSSMGYGDSGIPDAIPGGATLVFEVELLKVE